MKKFGIYKYCPYSSKIRLSQPISSIEDEIPKIFTQQTDVPIDDLTVDKLPVDELINNKKQKEEPVKQAQYNCYLNFIATHDKIANKNKRL